MTIRAASAIHKFCLLALLRKNLQQVQPIGTNDEGRAGYRHGPGSAAHHGPNFDPNGTFTQGYNAFLLSQLERLLPKLAEEYREFTTAELAFVVGHLPGDTSEDGRLGLARLLSEAWKAVVSMSPNPPRPKPHLLPHGDLRHQMKGTQQELTAENGLTPNNVYWALREIGNGVSICYMAELFTEGPCNPPLQDDALDAALSEWKNSVGHIQTTIKKLGLSNLEKDLAKLTAVKSFVWASEILNGVRKTIQQVAREALSASGMTSLQIDKMYEAAQSGETGIPEGPTTNLV